MADHLGAIRPSISKALSYCVKQRKSVILDAMFCEPSDHHPVGFLGYFFSPAVQFVTTVSGGADAKTKINRALTEDIKNFRTHHDFDHHPWRNMMSARDCQG